MISLIDFNNEKFLKENPNYVKWVYHHRYKDTNYSIIQEGRHTWAIYIIDDDFGIFELLEGYRTKKKAIEEIESGSVKRKILEQKFLYDKVVEII